MIRKVPQPVNENERIAELQEYNILDSLPENDFDDITKIASQICGTPISLISIVDKERQWFKSKQGLEVQETPRDVAFCAHAILEPSNVFVVKDATKDDRFYDNPLVTGAPHIAFYAGVPLVTENGNALGTLCILDQRPKELDDRQKETLRALANQVVCLLELRKKKEELFRTTEELKRANEDLERFAHVAAHDLKSPCNSILALTELLKDTCGSALEGEAVAMLDHIGYATSNLRKLIDNTLRHSLAAHNIRQSREYFTFDSLISELRGLLDVPEGLHFYSEASGESVFSVKSAWLQILLNLCTNAVKYNDKTSGFVKVVFSQDDCFYRFSVTDNGMGIPEDQLDSVFDLFHTLEKKDRFNESGTGIGLNTVKNLVDKLNGNIRVTSQVGNGTTFTVSIRK